MACRRMTLTRVPRLQVHSIATNFATNFCFVFAMIMMVWVQLCVVFRRVCSKCSAAAAAALARAQQVRRHQRASASHVARLCLLRLLLFSLLIFCCRLIQSKRCSVQFKSAAGRCICMHTLRSTPLLAHHVACSGAANHRGARRWSDAARPQRSAARRYG